MSLIPEKLAGLTKIESSAVYVKAVTCACVRHVTDKLCAKTEPVMCAFHVSDVRLS